MADAATNNYNLVKPEISGSADTWGNKLNTNMDKVDAQMKLNEDRGAASLPKDGSEDMTGLVKTVDVTPTDPLHLVHKKYVDAAIKAAIELYIPKKMVMMWGGTLGTIPAGWALCDGTIQNAVQTIDLRDKFIIGAGSTGYLAPATVGGTLTHNHGGNTGETWLTEAQLPSHSHTIYDPGHNHSISDPGHTHSYIRPDWSSARHPTGGSGFLLGDGDDPSNTGSKTTGISIVSRGTGVVVNAAGGGTSHLHTIAAVDHRPPFYALAFIMRVGVPA